MNDSWKRECVHLSNCIAKDRQQYLISGLVVEIGITQDQRNAWDFAGFVHVSLFK